MDRVGCVVSSRAHKKLAPPGLPNCRLGIILNAKRNEHPTLKPEKLQPKKRPFFSDTAVQLQGNDTAHGHKLRFSKELLLHRFGGEGRDEGAKIINSALILTTSLKRRGDKKPRFMPVFNIFSSVCLFLENPF